MGIQDRIESSTVCKSTWAYKTASNHLQFATGTPPGQADMAAICERDTLSVVVVGAGLSGIHCCSTILENTNVDVNVTLVEADERPGGRTKSVFLQDGTLVDFGACWVHSSKNNPATEFVKNHDAYKLTTLSLPFEENSKVHTSINENEVDFKKYASYFEEILEQIENETTQLQNISLQQAIDIAMTKYAATPVDELAKEGVDLEDVRVMKTLLPVLQECLAIMVGGDTKNLPTDGFDEGGGDGLQGNDLFVQSTYGTAFMNFYEKIRLKYTENFSVFLAHEVVSIRECSDGKKPLRILAKNRVTNGEKIFTADIVVVTVPLGVLKVKCASLFPDNILPCSKIESIKKLGFGKVLKLFLTFSSIFWNDDDDRGDSRWLIVPSSDNGNFQIFLDYSVATGRPILLGFAGGENAEILENCNITTIVEKACVSLSKGTGFTKAWVRAHLISAKKTNWGNNPYAYGAYSFLHKSSNKLDRHNLQVPICVGDSTTTNLYFAGEACHYTWSGTAHGAIDSGKKVALQIMEDYNLI